jgi:hypothetical protein
VHLLRLAGMALRRLVATRKSEPAAERARQQILADAHRHGNPRVDLRTLEAAGYVMVVTNLPSEVSPDSVLELYRLRWQIELKFKTFKSVIHLGNPPTKSAELLNVYLTAKLIVALLIEDFVHRAESFFPPGDTPSGPIQSWRLTRLLLDAVIAALTPALSLSTLSYRRLRCSRHLCPTHRKRRSQRAQALCLTGGLS